MPRIELRDPFGTSYQIVTLSSDLLRQWFAEWMPRLYPADEPRFGDPVILIWPAWDADKPDWLCDSRVLGRYEKIPRDPDLVMEALTQIRARLEREVEEMSRGRRADRA